MSPFLKIKQFVLSPFNKTKREIDLLKEHPIFREIDSWINIKVRALDIQSPSKKAMAEAYLTIYFKEIRTFYFTLCENYESYISSPYKIYHNLHKIITTTNQLATAVYIPSLFIEKMNVRFFKHIDILTQSIVSSSQKGSYSTEFEQTASILDMSLLFLHMEVDTIEHTINMMNGELEKILKGTIYDSSC